jgi:hypothetical protein
MSRTLAVSMSVMASLVSLGAAHADGRAITTATRGANNYAHLDRLAAEPYVEALRKVLQAHGGSIPLQMVGHYAYGPKVIALTGNGFELQSVIGRGLEFVDWTEVERQAIRRPKILGVFGARARERREIREEANVLRIEEQLKIEHAKLDAVAATGKLPKEWSANSAIEFSERAR